MTPDEQEALSRRFGDDVVILLPLLSGQVAIFNAARKLCGFVAPDDLVMDAWLQCERPTKPKADFTLEDLGL
jgi:hypothetical protein